MKEIWGTKQFYIVQGHLFGINGKKLKTGNRKRVRNGSNKRWAREPEM